jgi:hypothetical protein
MSSVHCRYSTYHLGPFSRMPELHRLHQVYRRVSYPFTHAHALPLYPAHRCRDPYVANADHSQVQPSSDDLPCRGELCA